MSLGENIYRLRSRKNLSQGDLADLLNISRQSVSRWETGSAVPELDKLVKLSRIFGVTLDELVTEAAPDPAPAAQPVPLPAGREQVPPHKIAGVVLLCIGALIVLLLALLGGFLMGLVFASPFLLCGVICLLARRRVGLWCGWAVYFTVDFYLRYATGISWRLTFFTLVYTPEMNYLRLFTAWCQLACMLLLTALSIVSFWRVRIPPTRKNIALLAGGWALLISARILLRLRGAGIGIAWYFLADWALFGLFTLLLTAALCILRRTGKQPGAAQ